MKKIIILTLSILSFCCYLGVAKKTKYITYKEKIEGNDSLAIHEGILSQHAQRIKYLRDGQIAAIIELSEPVMVAQAEQQEEWGFFQFPNICKVDNGSLIVSWQMNADSYTSYGKKSDRKNTSMMSKDGGRTWTVLENNYKTTRRGYNVRMNNGTFLNVRTPKAKDIRAYSHFPKAVGMRNNYVFYPMDQLPEELQGIYFNYQSSESKSEMIHASLHDSGLLRYAVDSLMPVVWWGNIKQLADNSLVAGVYPTFYQDCYGHVMPGGVSFYRSEDLGHSWNVISKIPFCYDGIAEMRGSCSFDEPTFELLDDSTFICVMRSGATSPLYKTFSTNRGKSWTKPLPFTPNGVKPQLMLLGNNVLVLSSGRPGVQLRFSFDGKGKRWTRPIEMIPFMKADGKYIRDVSCGYTSMIEADKNSFYIVYSDFTTKNKMGDVRKSIWFRKVHIKK